ncbi:MAG: hypothetical protein IH984_14970 [Planctomycetes bacterium]|nr:hypothetical protein [Planctomycetota bacterium]
MSRSLVELTQNHQIAPARYALFSDEEWALISDSLKLCRRELQVVQGVFADQTEQQIASHLDISYHTVHSYLIRIYRKLDVNSRCELLLEVFAEYRRQQASL